MDGTLNGPDTGRNSGGRRIKKICNILKQINYQVCHKVNDYISNHGICEGSRQFWRFQFNCQKDCGNSEEKASVADEPVSPVEDGPEINRNKTG